VTNVAGFSTLTIEEATERLIDYRGKTPPKTASGVRLVTAKVVKGGRIHDDPAEYIAADFYHEWMRRGLPQKLDVLLTTEAPLGEVAILRDDARIALAQRIILLRAKQGLLDPLYLFYALQSHFGQGELRARASGTTVLGIKQSELRQVRIPVCLLPLQRRIAGILSTYDELIENSQRRIKILESMARALYREWFVHFRFPGHESVPRVPSPLGEIPQGWEVRNVKDVATVTYGFPFASKKFNNDGIGTPVIRIRDIPEGRSATFTEEDAESKFHVKNGHILVGMDGAFHMCIWSGGHAFQNQRIARFESNGGIGNLHLFLALEKPIQEFNKAIVGTTVAHLGDMHIKTIQVAWAPTKLRESAREMLEPMSEQIIALKRQIHNLRRTRDLLLPRLLSGQIDVEATAS